MLEKLQLSVCPTTRHQGDPVDQMIRGGHYLRRWPGTVAAVFRLDSVGVPVGVITYSLPPREIFKRYSVTLAWELSRLWVSDEMPRNTESWFIAQTIRWLRKNRPDVELLVSYADPSRGHQGTIYKAANWKPDGKTDQERKTPRFDYLVQQPQREMDFIEGANKGKKCGRAAHVPKGATVERLPRVSKFRYTYRMG